jgi:hypothetical protein
MPKRRDTMLWSQVQGKEPQHFKIPPSDEGQRGTSFENERAALLPLEVERKKLCIKRWPKEIDLV